MRSSLALAAVLGSVAGPIACSSNERILADVPPSIAYVAILLEDSRGALIGATGLSPRVGPSSATFESTLDQQQMRDAEDVLLVGYTEATLRSLSSFPSEEILGAAALAVAARVDPVLPPHDWLASGELGGSPFVPVERALELTAAWLPRCPFEIRSPSDLVLDSNCSAYSCAAAVQGSGCSLSVQTSACDLMTLSGGIDGRGGLHVENSDRLSCAGDLSRTATGAEMSFVCSRPGSDQSCRLDLLRKPFSSILAADTLQLIDAPYTPETGDLAVNTSGYVGGLAVLPDRLVVAVTDSRSRPRSCPDRARAAPGRFVFVDPDRLVVTGTAAAPPCAGEIAPDPSGDGFIAAAGRTLRLKRYDARGRLLSEVEIPDPGGLGPERYVVGLVTTADPPRVHLAVTSAAGSGEGYVLAYALPSFELEITSSPIGGEIADVALEPAFYDVLDVDHNSISLIERSNGTLRTRPFPLNVPCGIQSADPARLVYHLGAMRILLANLSGAAELLYISPRETPFGCRAATFYETAATAFAIETWPGSDRLAAVGVHDDDTQTARVALFDAEVGRFLPGSVEVGRGVVSTIRADPGSERVFVVLPWSASIARVARLR